MGNAVKFAEQGEVVVRVERAEGNAGILECWNAGMLGLVMRKARSGKGAAGQSDGPTDQPSDRPTVLLRFTVQDTGIGIPEDKIKILFNKFNQVDASITRKFGGTGLGLAISKQLAELMGGEVGVSSILGQGSRFWFTARFDIQETSPAMSFTQPRELAGLHVLVVDDNATNLEILLKQFASWDMRPQGATGGQAALEASAAAYDRDDLFDLAVVDFQMPGMDGGELGKRLKADPRFQAMPLVMLTSLGRPGDARMCADLGFAAYLNKPVRQSELYDTLALAMGDTGPRTPAQPIITRHIARENQRRQMARPRFSGHILVAEDNPVNKQVALGMLKKLGLRADVVSNGLEAIHALRTTPYDLVLMDVMMPEMDGLCATREIRRLENDHAGMLEYWNVYPVGPGSPTGCPTRAGIGNAGAISDSANYDEDAPISAGKISQHSSILKSQHVRRLPMIALTAGAMPEDREKCLAAGMEDYLSKPIKPVDLARVLERWLPVTGDRGQGVEDRSQMTDDSRQRAGEGDIRIGECAGTEQEAKGEEPTRAEDAPPVFDRSALLDRLMGDEELVRVVLNSSLENIPQRIQELQAALDVGDAPSVHMQAHTIKGMAANISAEGLRNLADTMEAEAQNGNLDAVRGRMDDVKRLFKQLRTIIGDRHLEGDME